MIKMVLTVVAVLVSGVLAAGFVWLAFRVAERVHREGPAGGLLFVLMYGTGAMVTGFLCGYYGWR